jgi:non-homologous end joining protein Ku
MKTLLVLKLTLLVSFLSIGMAMSQTKFVREMQEENNWDHYQDTWYKETLADLKQTKRDTRKSNKAENKQSKRTAKLIKLRKDISKLARKEGGNE